MSDVFSQILNDALTKFILGNAQKSSEVEMMKFASLLLQSENECLRFRLRNCQLARENERLKEELGKMRREPSRFWDRHCTGFPTFQSYPPTSDMQHQNTMMWNTNGSAGHVEEQYGFEAENFAGNCSARRHDVGFPVF